MLFEMRPWVGSLKEPNCVKSNSEIACRQGFVGLRREPKATVANDFWTNGFLVKPQGIDPQAAVALWLGRSVASLLPGRGGTLVPTTRHAAYSATWDHRPDLEFQVEIVLPPSLREFLAKLVQVAAFE